MNAFSLAELAQRFELELVGDGSTLITGLCTLAPGEPGKLGFLANPHYRTQLAATGAAAVIVSKRDVANLSTPGLLAPDPYLAFARIAKLFDHSRQFSAGIDATAVIDLSAQIGVGCRVGAYCVIEADVVLGDSCVVGPSSVLRRGCRIGAGGRLEARVMVAEGVQIGARVLLQPGAVIGSRGFGNARLPDGSWEEVPQLGSVRIGDDVEVGANTTIDRGALGDTVIEDGVKLDNQIQIAHNCVIGAHTAIAGSAGVAGSTKIGKRCMIGGAVNIGGHLVIADDVVLLGRAMVTGSITEAGVYGSGLPHAPAREWRKQVARVRRLHLLEARVKLLEHALKLKPCEDDNNEGEA